MIYLPTERTGGGDICKDAGFVTGVATTCTFFHEEKNIRVAAHGGDFIIERVECELKVGRAMLGPERTDGMTRKSTNGGSILMNGACLKTWSTTQLVIARSSGKEEYYAAVKCAGAMALQLMGALGLKVTVVMHSDSSTCRDLQSAWPGEPEAYLLRLQQCVQ